MGFVKIHCPNCNRVLGDTSKSVDCNFNCRGCKKAVNCKIQVASFDDYLITKKEV